MRRVNGVMREVISTTIGGELQDPRIGFVTVTAVETSSDLAPPRFYVSVLGTEEERGCDDGGAAVSARRDPGGDRDRAAHEADADPDLRLRRRVERADRMHQVMDSSAYANG